MQIGEVAERVGLSLRSVRYYEEVGLVQPVDRTAGGFRIYDDAAIERLKLVRDLKPLGFTLDEIRELVEIVEGAAGRERRSMDDDGAAGERVRQYAQRARDQHRRAKRSLEAAERIIELLDSLTRQP